MDEAETKEAPPAADGENPGVAPRVRGWLWQVLRGWGPLILLVLVVRWTGCEPYTIPTGSMEPTLHGDPRYFRGDHLATNKLVYGPRVPFTSIRLFRLGEPKRWDIVVFRNVQKDAEHPVLVKRIVGLPGERIHIDGGGIWVNGEPVEPPESLRGTLNYTTRLVYSEGQVRRLVLEMAKDQMWPAFLNPLHAGVQDFYADLQTLSKELDGRDPSAFSDAEVDEIVARLRPKSMPVARDLFALDQQERYPMRYGVLPDDEFSLVPDGCYLVCGDNSADSVDGRVWGWLPNGNIMGRVFCIWWPLGRWRDFTGFSKTWWGRGALYGIPAGVVLFEVISQVRKRRKRIL